MKKIKADDFKTPKEYQDEYQPIATPLNTELFKETVPYLQKVPEPERCFILPQLPSPVPTLSPIPDPQQTNYLPTEQEQEELQTEQTRIQNIYDELLEQQSYNEQDAIQKFLTQTETNICEQQHFLTQTETNEFNQQILTQTETNEESLQEHFLTQTETNECGEETNVVNGDECNNRSVEQPYTTHKNREKYIDVKKTVLFTRRRRRRRRKRKRRRIKNNNKKQ